MKRIVFIVLLALCSICLDAQPLLQNASSHISWCTYEDGTYYYICPQGKDIMLRASSDITTIADAPQVIAWSVGALGSKCDDAILRRIDGVWYLYCSVRVGDINHRSIFVLENTSEDPLKGKFVVKGRLNTGSSDCIAIQPHVFEYHGGWYVLWSGWDEPRTFEENQNLYIDRLINPWTTASSKVKVSQPQYEWERQWVGENGNTVAYPIYVNEGPCFLESPDGSGAFIFYSASLRWTPYHCIGMLSLRPGADIMQASSWEKSSEPVFTSSERLGIYSVGRPCFLPSPDGSGLLFCYQSTSLAKSSDQNSHKDVRLKKVSWRTSSDGVMIPVLGQPE